MLCTQKGALCLKAAGWNSGSQEIFLTIFCPREVHTSLKTRTNFPRLSKRCKNLRIFAERLGSEGYIFAAAFWAWLSPWKGEANEKHVRRVFALHSAQSNTAINSRAMRQSSATWLYKDASHARGAFFRVSGGAPQLPTVYGDLSHGRFYSVVFRKKS